jgi:spermidine synthase
MPTTVVELNPQVVAVNRAWFHLPAEVEVIVQEAGRWLRESAPPQSVQLLHVDLYDHEAAAPVLDDEAFYVDCRRVLDDGGVMSVNLFGRDASFERSMAHIAGAFGAEAVWSLQPTREGNTIAVAARGLGLPDRDALLQRAAAIEARFGAYGLPARKWLRMMRPWAGSAVQA